MSNINPDPVPYAKRFKCGGATAAVGGFPYPGHRTLKQVWAWRDKREAEIARAAHNLTVCRICKGRSPEWKVGHCPACNNTGLPT